MPHDRHDRRRICSRSAKIEHAPPLGVVYISLSRSEIELKVIGGWKLLLISIIKLTLHQFAGV